MKMTNYIDYFLSCFEQGEDYRKLYYELKDKYENDIENRPTLIQYIFTTIISFIGGFIICYIILKGRV